MNEILKAPFAKIDIEKGLIILFNHEPKIDYYKNVIVEIDNNNVMKIKADFVKNSVTLSRLFVEDMKNKPDERDVEYGYKNPIDFFTGTKKPYVYGWYRLKETKPFKAKLSKWTIKY